MNNRNPPEQPPYYPQIATITTTKPHITGFKKPTNLNNHRNKTHITSVQKPTNCNNHNNKTNKSQQPSQQKPASPVFKNPQATNNPIHHNRQPTESTDLRRLCTRKTKGGWGFSVRDKRKRMGVCRARSKKGVGFCHVTKGKGKGGLRARESRNREGGCAREQARGGGLCKRE
jgi:hypothetical protein